MNEQTVPLSQKEVLVLKSLANGLTAKQIACSLGNAESTVKHHLAAIRLKLNTKNSVESVAVALTTGYLEKVTGVVKTKLVPDYTEL